jgi:Flp pilus assembly CpaE family ATPase
MASQAISVLLIEDNPGDARLVRELLKDAPSAQFQVTDAQRLSDGIARLAQAHFDIVLLDLRLPDSQGLDTFTRLHGQAPDMPIVVMTGLQDETIAVRAVQQGAQDYLVKGQVQSEQLSRAIRYAVARHATRMQLVQGWQTARKGKLFGFWGAKGGVGTTTVTLNVACALRAKGYAVIALELNSAYGSFSAQIGGAPAANLSQLKDMPPEQLSERELSSRLLAAANGLRVLFGPQKVSEFGEIDPEVARAVVERLAGMADYTLVDIGSHPTPAARAAAERCDFVVLVAVPEPAWLESARIALELLRSWNVPAERVGMVIVNRGSLFTSIDLREVCSRMRCGVVGAIPSAADDMLAAQQRARPLVLSDPDSKAAISLFELTDRLSADSVSPMALPTQ